MIIVVISDISGLDSISDETLKKVTGVHDMLFINIGDASIVGDDLYDLDSSYNVPSFISIKQIVHFGNSKLPCSFFLHKFFSILK